MKVAFSKSLLQVLKSNLQNNFITGRVTASHYLPTQMNKYEVRLSKENTGKLFSATVEAQTEQEAFLKAVAMAKQKGINVPDEVWTKITLIK